MDGLRGMQLGMTALVAGIVGIGAAAGSHAATNAAAEPGASEFATVGVNLGLPVLGVASLINVPGAAAGGPMPAALLGAIGVGTIAGTVAAAFD